MALETTTVTAFGSSSVFDYAGGNGAITVTGTVGGVTRLMISLDDTNYSEAAKFSDAGSRIIGNLPACKMRWDTKDLNFGALPDFVANVETA